MADLDLHDYLPYLLNRAGARIAASFTLEARKHGLTLQMWRVLAALEHQEGQTVGDLAHTTSTEISTLSRLLDQMQKKHLILRQREGMDQRVVTVRRTAAGRSATQRLLPTAIAYENAALQGFSAREAATLKAMLKRLYANMDALDRETPQSPAKTRSA